MAQKEDYYQTLGVKKTASAEDIRKSYLRLARKHHPDVNPGDSSAEDKFKKISEAYEVLSDPGKREVYDQHGAYSDHLRDFNRSGGGGWAPPPDPFNTDPNASRGSGWSTGGVNGWDAFNKFFRNPTTQNTTRPQRGQDIEVALPISFEESINGRTATVNVRRNESCSSCLGSGESSDRSSQVVCGQCGGRGKVSLGSGIFSFDQGCETCNGSGKQRPPCQLCQGTGSVIRTESVRVQIPAGVNTGSRVRLSGRGNAGSRGGPPGDLFIVTNVADNEIFKRKGDNIYCTIPITIPEAALGARIQVPTVSGKAQLRIPPGTQTGQVFRLREKGAPSLRGSTRGDQYVEVRITLPKIIDEDSKKLLQEFERRNPENPRVEMGLE